MKLLLLLLPLWLVNASTIYASEKFYTKHDVEYSYTDLGQAQVSHTVSLINIKPGIYASGYQIKLKGDPPGIVSGRDAKGPLQITTSQTEPDTTTLDIRFNDQVAGLGNTMEFNLNYSGRAASHKGQVWEINLPKVGETDEIDEYNLHLIIPSSFGKLAFISPTPMRHEGSKYSFTKGQISRVGVVAAFGNFQTFNFNLKFELNNPTPKTVIGEISLPPDTNYQQVSYTSIDPKPESILVDNDGNWLAQYKLKPKENLTISAVGQAHILAEPTTSLFVPNASQLQKYLQPTAYWSTHDPKVLELARKYKTPQAIYDYVVSTLSYDYARSNTTTTRKGGLMALQDPRASVCTEFTDLFITIARAAGIPAREVNGYGYTTDTSLRPRSLQNVFHAWPQYWDYTRQQWVNIDPTWGKTTGGVDYFNKLDFNHMTFVIHGESDSSPAISSSYAHVDFGEYQEFGSIAPQVNWHPPWVLFPYGPNTGVLTITNISGRALYQLPANITTTGIDLVNNPSREINVLAPFTSFSIPIKFEVGWIPQFAPMKMTYTGPGENISGSSSYNISEKLFLPWEITVGIVIAIIFAALGWLATKAWGVHLQRRHRASNLRG